MYWNSFYFYLQVYLICYFGNKAIDLIDWIRHNFLYSYYQHNEGYIFSK